MNGKLLNKLIKRLAVENVVQNEPKKELYTSLSIDKNGNINKEQE
jgi:hypothetical protein